MGDPDQDSISEKHNERRFSMNKKNKKSAITGNKETSKIEGAVKTPKFNLKNGIDLRGQIKRVNPMESVGVKIFLIFCVQL